MVNRNRILYHWESRFRSMQFMQFVVTGMSAAVPAIFAILARENSVTWHQRPPLLLYLLIPPLVNKITILLFPKLFLFLYFSLKPSKPQIKGLYKRKKENNEREAYCLNKWGKQPHKSGRLQRKDRKHFFSDPGGTRSTKGFKRYLSVVPWFI